MMSRTQLLVLPLALLSLLGALGCGTSGGGASLVKISVTPNPVNVVVGGTQALSVTASFSDGSTQPVTGATFATGDATIATVSGSGLVTAVAKGTTSVTIAYSGQSQTVAVTVTSATATLDHLTIAPKPLKLAGAATQQLTVTGTYSDASTADLTSSSTFLSDNPSVATVNSGGLVTGTAAGSTVVHATASGKTDTVTVTVVTLDSIAITPSPLGLTVGRTGQLTVTGTYSDASTKDLTSSSTFSSNSTTVATVSSPGGLVTAMAVGSATITASSGGKNSTVTVTVGAAPTLVSIAITPSPITLAVAATQQLAVTGTYSDNSTQTLTSTSTFSSDAPSIATVTSPGGLVTGVALGSAQVTATVGGKTRTVAVTVSAVSPCGGPTTIATAPTALPENAISLFSATYTGTAADDSAKVDTWLTSWSGAGSSVADCTVTGTSHVVKKYVLRNYGGIEFLGTQGSHEIDIATPGMTKFHMDVWSPDGSHLVIKLVDAGANKVISDPPDADDSVKITLGGVTLPGQSQWVSIDLTISTMAVQQAAWVGKNVGQIVIALDTPAAGGTLYVDNLYWYKTAGSGGGSAPTTVAPTPTLPANKVISLFSSAYPGGTANGDYSGRVDSYQASCFGGAGPTVADFTIAGTSHKVKEYTLTASSFALIETIGATGGTAVPPDSALCNGGTQSGTDLINATAMTTLHFDVWSPGGSTNFNVHLVNANSANFIPGPGAPGGTPAADEYVTGASSVAVGTWVSFEIPFSTLGPPGAVLNRVGLVKLFSADPGTFFVDNIYFHN